MQYLAAILSPHRGSTPSYIDILSVHSPSPAPREVSLENEVSRVIELDVVALLLGGISILICRCMDAGTSIAVLLIHLF